MAAGSIVIQLDSCPTRLLTPTYEGAMAVPFTAVIGKHPASQLDVFVKQNEKDKKYYDRHVEREDRTNRVNHDRPSQVSTLNR